MSDPYHRLIFRLEILSQSIGYKTSDDDALPINQRVTRAIQQFEDTVARFRETAHQMKNSIMEMIKEKQREEYARYAYEMMPVVLQAMEALCATPRPDLWNACREFYVDLGYMSNEEYMWADHCFYYFDHRPFVAEEWDLPDSLKTLVAQTWRFRCGCSSWVGKSVWDDHWQELLDAAPEPQRSVLAQGVPYIQSRCRVFVWKEVVRRWMVIHTLTEALPLELAHLVGQYLSVTRNSRYESVHVVARRIDECLTRSNVSH